MKYRNVKLLRAIRESPCQMCFIQDDTIVAAHSNQQRDGKGVGLKSHDFRIAALCYKCHYDIDHGNKMTREQKRQAWEEAHRNTIGWLFMNGFLIVDIK